MNMRTVRYIITGIIITLLVAGNIIVHIASVRLSERALSLEREISSLKRQNMQIQEQALSQSSLQMISAFAQSQGYRSSGPAIRWMDPVIASR